MVCGNIEVLEGSLVRVPFESLKRAAKDRKSVLDETQQLAQEALQPTGEALAPGLAAEKLTNLLDELQDLKKKLQGVSVQEKDEARRCLTRLQHLNMLGEQRPTMTGWNGPRLDRLLVDYLQRQELHETAKMLADSAGIKDLVDAHVFEDATKIAAALRAHDCGPALAWCTANKTRLKKAKSQLEFQLRVQEFMELVKSDKKVLAIAYARQHLAPWATQFMTELQRALAVLVFANRMSAPARYQTLLSESQWDNLVTLFYQDLYRLHGLPLTAPLLPHLQAGLSALKTPASFQPNCSCQDPLSGPLFQELAQPLPYAKHVRSQLLCSITRKLMDDANPPIVLPNGYVYSQAAIDLIRQQNKGRVVCPQTGQSYSSDELRRAYIV